MGVIVNTDPSFAAEGAWTGLHDWWTRHLQSEKKNLPIQDFWKVKNHVTELFQDAFKI